MLITVAVSLAAMMLAAFSITSAPTVNATGTLPAATTKPPPKPAKASTKPAPKKPIKTPAPPSKPAVSTKAPPKPANTTTATPTMPGQPTPPKPPTSSAPTTQEESTPFWEGWKLPNSLPGTDCLRPPTAANPRDGLAAWLDPGPTTPRNGDPFQKNSTVSIYETYGYGGYTTPIYDPGCLNGARFWDGPNDIANLATDTSATLIAITVRLTRFVTDGTIGSILAPFTTTLVSTLHAHIFIPLIGLAVVLTGLYFLARTQRADLAHTGTASMKAAGIILIGLLCATWALSIGAAIDAGITTVFKATNHTLTTTTHHVNADAADTVAANLTEQLLYTAWVHKSFGNNPAAATEYGPALFKAGALTRAEQHHIDAHPDTTSSVLEAKKKEYKRVAKDIEAKYPQAYEVLAGNNSWPRVGFAAAHLLGTLISIALLLWALAHILYAIVVTRIGVALAPGIAVLTQHPRMQHHAINAATWIARTCLIALTYTVIFVLVLVAGIGGILNPATPWHPVAKLATMAITTLAIWHLLRRTGLTTAWTTPHRLSRRTTATTTPEPSPGGTPPSPTPQPPPTPAKPGGVPSPATPTAVVPRGGGAPPSAEATRHRQLAEHPSASSKAASEYSDANSNHHRATGNTVTGAASSSARDTRDGANSHHPSPTDPDHPATHHTPSATGADPSPSTPSAASSSQQSASPQASTRSGPPPTTHPTGLDSTPASAPTTAKKSLWATKDDIPQFTKTRTIA